MENFKRHLPTKVFQDLLLFDATAKHDGFEATLIEMILRSQRDRFLEEGVQPWKGARSIYRSEFRPRIPRDPDAYSVDFEKRLLRVFQVSLPDDSKEDTRSALTHWGAVWIGIDDEMPEWAFEVFVFNAVKRTFLKIPIQRFGLQNMTGVPYDSERLTGLASLMGMDLGDDQPPAGRD